MSHDDKNAEQTSRKIREMTKQIADLQAALSATVEQRDGLLAETERLERALLTLRATLDSEDWIGEVSMHQFIDIALCRASNAEPLNLSDIAYWKRDIIRSGLSSAAKVVRDLCEIDEPTGDKTIAVDVDDLERRISIAIAAVRGAA